MPHHQQEVSRARGSRVSVGCLGVVLFLAPSFFFLLLGCVGISRGCSSLVSVISWFEASSVSLRRHCCRGRDIEWRGRGWETILLIAMLESSCSRSVPSKKAMLMVCSITLEAWRSTIIEVSCLRLIPTIIECKYSRSMTTMGSRSCPSSERKATNQGSSSIRGMLRSITIMIASSSLIVTIMEYNHGL